jgi:hypothetical protein
MENIPHEVLQQGGFVGPRFTGVFLFQNVFWRVAIPLVVGTVSINALDALRIMPLETKRLLSSRRNDMREYLKLWADCCDYDMGYQASAQTVTRESFLGEMIESTERELTSAVADLCQQRPNSKAVHSARDATEKALKAYLCHHAGLTHDQAKNKFGHRLAKLVQEVSLCTPKSPLVLPQEDLDAFAPYEDRYSSKKFARMQLWRAYRIAQFTAAEVLRSISGRNMLAVVLRDPIFFDNALVGQSFIEDVHR